MDSKKEVVCSEAELIKAYNKMLNYVDFLERKRIEFNNILAAIEGGAIADQKICAALSEISDAIKVPNKIVSKVINYRIRFNISSEVNGIENADKFKYTDSAFDEIKTILKRFVQ